MKMGGGKAGVLFVARTKLCLHTYRATVRYSEGKERLVEFCILREGLASPVDTTLPIYVAVIKPVSELTV
jgi:hypothetical protein